MPQILKEELRENIITSASAEFCMNGYENTSVRAIAKSAGMTVGNLYRYFENKRDILDSIILPIIDLFDEMLLKYTDNTISIHDTPVIQLENYQNQKNTIKNSIDNMADELAVILQDNAEGIMVLTANDSLIENRFSEWFKALVLNYIPYMLEDDREMDKVMDVVYESYAHSALSGIMFIISKTGEFTSKDELAKLLKRYVYLLLRIDE